MDPDVDVIAGMLERLMDLPCCELKALSDRYKESLKTRNSEILVSQQTENFIEAKLLESPENRDEYLIELAETREKTKSLQLSAKVEDAFLLLIRTVADNRGINLDSVWRWKLHKIVHLIQSFIHWQAQFFMRMRNNNPAHDNSFGFIDFLICFMLLLIYFNL